ncbi:MAG: ribulose-phosphate 3-epimerase [Hymenobacteraceae bacterium]|nr:ribulose-phosphate 3-epimerase [Hymenobacteraceae bacterium]
MASLLAPSLLAADFGRLAQEIARLRTPGAADWLHCDVMDGRFVPNISFGLPVVEAIRRAAGELPLDVHLMIEEPGRYLEAFVRAGAHRLTVHLEACPHLHRVVEQIRTAGCAPGVALNPHTPVALLADIIADVDLVLIMSVNPGFGGQRFIEHTYRKVAETRELIERTGRPIFLQVDGGVGESNIGALVQAGADVFVAGSSVFSGGEPVSALQKLRAAANPLRR